MRGGADGECGGDMGGADGDWGGDTGGADGMHRLSGMVGLVE